MKTVLSIVLVMVFGVTQAQQTVIDRLLEDYERSKALTLAYVEAMPADQFNYRPNDSVKTYAEQMLHMAQATIGITANGSGADRLYEGVNLEKDPNVHSKEEVKRLITESYDFAIEGLRSLELTQMGDIVEMGTFKVSRIGWFEKAEEHIVHHRGACAVYLRMVGIKPPGYQLF